MPSRESSSIPTRQLPTVATTPKRIVCAEPSPDVAQALSTALSSAIEADQQRAQNATSGSAAFATSTTEGIAQLGERLATIQLLRDGFYRACEAYSNGAISDTMYTLIIGNIDDVMVTLLTTEMAAGAFGRQLAGISGLATAAAGEQEAAQEELAEIDAKLETQEAELTAINGQIRETENKKTVAIGKGEAGQQEVAELDGQLADLRSDRDAAQMLVTQLQFQKRASEKAAANSFVASLVQTGGGISRSPTDSGVKAIADIYKAFTERDSMGSLVAACVAALDRAPNTSGRHPETNRHVDTGTMVGPDGKPMVFPNSTHYATELTHVCKHLFHPSHGGGIIVEMFKAKLKHTRQMAVIEQAGVTKELKELYRSQCPNRSDASALCDNLRSIVGS